MLHLERRTHYITLKPLLPVVLTAFNFSWLWFIINRLMDSVDCDIVQESTLSQSVIAFAAIQIISVICCWVLGNTRLVALHHLLLQLFKLHGSCSQVKTIFVSHLVIGAVSTRSGQVGVCPSPIVVRLRRLANAAVLICVLNRPDDVFWGAMICLFQFFA